MLIGELVNSKNILVDKIRELEDYVSNNTVKEVSSDIINRMFEYTDKHRSYLILLEKSNTTTIIKAADSNLSVSSAVILRKCVEKKIDFLSDLVVLFGIDQVAPQRDKLYEEYQILDNAIKKSDWSTTID